MSLMFFIFSEFSKLGKDLILESNFHTKELEKLHEIARDNNTVYAYRLNDAITKMGITHSDVKDAFVLFEKWG